VQDKKRATRGRRKITVVKRLKEVLGASSIMSFSKAHPRKTDYDKDDDRKSFLLDLLTSQDEGSRSNGSSFENPRGGGRLRGLL